MNKNVNAYHQSDSDIAQEEQVLRKAMQNPEAFAPIYDKYYLAIYKYVLQRVCDDRITQEIVSDVFAKAIFNLKKYKFKGTPFSSWLYRVAFNEIANRHRKKKKERVVHITEEIWELFPQNSSEADIELEPKLKALKVVLNQLKSTELELIEMRFFENRPFKEIGEIMDLTTENARVKTHRALKKLQTLFKKTNHGH